MDTVELPPILHLRRRSGSRGFRRRQIIRYGFTPMTLASEAEAGPVEPNNCVVEGDSPILLTQQSGPSPARSPSRSPQPQGNTLGSELVPRATPRLAGGAANGDNARRIRQRAPPIIDMISCARRGPRRAAVAQGKRKLISLPSDISAIYEAATGHDVHSWSFGAVSAVRNPAASGWRKIRTLDDLRTFGPTIDYQCVCAKCPGCGLKAR